MQKHIRGPVLRDDAPGLSFTTMLTFAVASGLSVANVYYAQPMLDVMAADLGISPAAIGGIITLTQIGYALGLIFIVPLGDLMNRRRLIVGQAIASAAALTLVATARSEIMLLAAMVAVGLLAVVVQVLVAFAASLAAPSERGRAVGMVTSGIVIGILLARAIAGVLTDLGGWRSVYFTSAAMSLIMAAVLYRMLPAQDGQRASGGYIALIRSVPMLFVAYPLLRVRATLGMLIFASLTTFWTSLVLPLSAPPLSLTHTQIGLFGFVGVAGALAASSTGRLADHGYAQWTTGGALALLLVAWWPLSLLHQSLAALIAGVIILDLAIQAVHVTNQSIIFTLQPDARSRLVAGYMVFYSIGSALGAIASTMVYVHGGWAAVCTLGAALSALALLFWAATRHVGAGSGS